MAHVVIETLPCMVTLNELPGVHLRPVACSPYNPATPSPEALSSYPTVPLILGNSWSTIYYT